MKSIAGQPFLKLAGKQTLRKACKKPLMQKIAIGGIVEWL